MKEYTELIGKFEEISYTYINFEVLNKLKDDYKFIINSRRLCEKINSIGSLFKALEKRGVLQYNEIKILKDIEQQYIKNEYLKELISEYEQWLQNKFSYINNLYTLVSKFSYSEFEMQKNVHYPTTAVFDLLLEKKLQKLIINKIGKKIGKYWADVCRNLNLEESIIEEIEMKYFNEINSFEKMFNQALNLYLLENNLKWKNDLMQALESSRRKDLKEMVKEILFQYNS